MARNDNGNLLPAYRVSRGEYALIGNDYRVDGSGRLTSISVEIQSLSIRIRIHIRRRGVAFGYRVKVRLLFFR